MRREEMMELKSVIRLAMEESMELYDERWITGEELCKQFQMFSKDWLKRYGHALQRRQAVVTDEQGNRHRTSWVYPQHKIARMIANGEIRELRCLDTMKIPEARIISGIAIR